MGKEAPCGVFSTIILTNLGKLLFIFSLVSEKKRFIIRGRLERGVLGINSIVETERRARDITAQAQAQRELLDRQVEEATEEMRQRFHQQAQQRIAQAKREEEEQQKRSMQELEERLRAALDDLERKGQVNHSVWAQALFDRIVGGEERSEGPC